MQGWTESKKNTAQRIMKKHHRRRRIKENQEGLTDMKKNVDTIWDKAGQMYYMIAFFILLKRLQIITQLNPMWLE